MKRILFAFLFLFSCALTGCTERLSAEEDVLSAVSEEIADLEELESRIEELCEGEGAVHEENRKMIAAVGKKFEEAKAEMEKNQEELRQSWAALPEDVAVKLLQRLVEDPELKISSVRSLCPENISLTDFLKMVNVGKRCAPAIREYIFAEAANDKAKELGDTFVATSLAGLEQAVDEKKAEILLKLMEDCPGYNDMNADFPLEELIPPIDALVEKFGWNEKKVVDAAENFWLTARPCVGPGARMVKTVDGIEYAFRWCPAGTFTMGGTGSDEKPHSVMLTKGFWMLETEVTQAMWKSVMGTTVRQQRDKADPDWPLRGEGSDYPIYYVNWEESRTFCEKLSSKLGVQGSLPTEAQWEYACRAGTTGAYAGDLDAMAWYDSNSGDKTHPVGQKKANEWGLKDMHGNVWEWCSDWYASDYYVESPTSDPTGPNSGSGRVNRGGWDDYAGHCRSAYRYRGAPGFRDYNLGFRIVLAESDK